VIVIVLTCDSDSDSDSAYMTGPVKGYNLYRRPEQQFIVVFNEIVIVMISVVPWNGNATQVRSFHGCPWEVYNS